MKKIRKLIWQGERYPRGYGMAWLDFERNAAVCYPIPLNVVMRAAYLAWVWCLCPFGVTEREEVTGVSSEESGREAFPRSPGPALEPGKEAPLAEQSLPQQEFPRCDCENCASRVAESVALRARAQMLRAAVNDREPWGVVAHHAVELVEMMRARGMV